MTTVQPSDVREAPHDLYANGHLLHVGVPAEQVRINVGKAQVKGFDLAQEADGTVCLLGRRFVPQTATPNALPHHHPQQGEVA
ncbi:hypothetical protein [Streptomyces sp. NPDC050534]|uniref:hypothetical protein n=1 Tax=Streptomyces sp. NPDC050534 TaxID=3365625 RepID=UPI00378F67D0